MTARDKIVGMMAGTDPDAGRLRDTAERVADEILAEYTRELAVDLDEIRKDPATSKAYRPGLAMAALRLVRAEDR